MAALAEPRVPYPVWERVRAPFAAFGEASDGRWVEPPLLQPLSRLLDFAGEQLRSRLFVVQGNGPEELCLRPDFTLPVALTHIESGAAEGRYLYEGLAFRAAPPGSARASEFRQIGAELFGATTPVPEQDAELIALAWKAAAAGGRGDLGLMLGDAGLFASFVQALGFPRGAAARLSRALANPHGLAAELGRARAGAPEPGADGGRLSAILAALPEAEGAQVLEEIWRLADVRPVGGRSAADIVHRLAERAAGDRGDQLTVEHTALIERFLQVSAPPWEALDLVADLSREAGVDLEAALQAWGERLDALADAGAPVEQATLATGFIRPFAYYDGVLFEVRSPALGPDQPVAAGGRYDGLLARLGAEPGTAIGCVVRPGRAWTGEAA